MRVEEHGEAYYINPSNLEELYLGTPQDAFEVMRSKGLGITNKDLEKIEIGKSIEAVIEARKHIPVKIDIDQQNRDARDAREKAKIIADKKIVQEQTKVCNNECTVFGEIDNNRDGYKICENYDSCLEWHYLIECPKGSIYQPQNLKCVNLSNRENLTDLALKEDAINALVDEDSMIWHKWKDKSQIVTYSFESMPPDYIFKQLSASNQEAFQENWVKEKFNRYKEIFRKQIILFENISKIKFKEIESAGDIQIYASPHCGGMVNSQNVEYLSVGINDQCAGEIFGIKNVFTHELGHALGLNHPREFPIEEINDDRWTMGKVLLSDVQDTTQFSIMSNFGHNFYEGYHVWSHAPLIYDIAAIQYMYGVNEDYNNDDTVYRFTIENQPALTIWDAGGNDTFDLSNHTRDVIIDLRTAGFSSIGWQTKNETYLIGGPAKKNISIAWDVQIENAIGGTGDDVIYNNIKNNIIDGGTGEDGSYAI